LRGGEGLALLLDLCVDQLGDDLRKQLAISKRVGRRKKKKNRSNLVDDNANDHQDNAYGDQRHTALALGVQHESHGGTSSGV